MHVIGHDLHCVDRYVELFGDFAQERDKAFFYITNKHWAAIFGAPHEMILERVDGISIFSVTRVHTDSIHAADNKSSIKRRAALPLSAKSDSPRAA